MRVFTAAQGVFGHIDVRWSSDESPHSCMNTQRHRGLLMTDFFFFSFQYCHLLSDVSIKSNAFLEQEGLLTSHYQGRHYHFCHHHKPFAMLITSF